MSLAVGWRDSHSPDWLLGSWQDLALGLRIGLSGWCRVPGAKGSYDEWRPARDAEDEDACWADNCAGWATPLTLLPTLPSGDALLVLQQFYSSSHLALIKQSVHW